MRSFIISKHHQMSLVLLAQHPGIVVGKRPLETPGRQWEDHIKLILKEIGRKGVAGFMWLRIGAGGGLL
jgi:hypothetical protein